MENYGFPVSYSNAFISFHNRGFPDVPGCKVHSHHDIVGKQVWTHMQSFGPA